MFSDYHAHVYFDKDSVAQATALCEQAGKRFGVAVGRVHQKNVGPHPRWSCQLAFGKDKFDGLIAWLDANRNGLTVFVHGLTDDPLTDHTTNASWLGEAVELNLEMFRT